VPTAELDDGRIHRVLTETPAILSGRDPGDLLERPIETAERIKSGIVSDVDHPLIGRDQLPLGVCDPMPGD